MNLTTTVADAARTVTPEQVERAVTQLRERPGLSAVEQIHAVLRALELTVTPAPVIPRQRGRVHR